MQKTRSLGFSLKAVYATLKAERGTRNEAALIEPMIEYYCPKLIASKETMHYKM